MIFKGTHEYLEWLKLCGCDLDPHNEYNLLFRDLYSTVFEYRIDYDDNRIYEALSIRDEYDGDSGLHPDDVNMLELIRSLAMRCAEMSFDSTELLTITEWFWKMLSYVGLTKFVDSEYLDNGGSEAVRTILYRIINRTYKRNGQGGLLPLKNPKCDQRRVDLWDQMNEYVSENCY